MIGSFACVAEDNCCPFSRAAEDLIVFTFSHGLEGKPTTPSPYTPMAGGRAGGWRAARERPIPPPDGDDGDGGDDENLANTNVLWHSGRLLALWEVRSP